MMQKVRSYEVALTQIHVKLLSRVWPLESSIVRQMALVAISGDESSSQYAFER